MPTPIPLNKPKLKREALVTRISKHIRSGTTSPAKSGPDKVDPSKEMVIVGIRGYFKKTMGDPRKNDRGIYDDALFIIGPHGYAAFNGNTDPAAYRAGFGVGDDKGIASLAPGVWRVYKFDDHKPTNKKQKPYPALCQRAGKVTVWRDSEDGAYEDTGNFGINIHRGGIERVSSLGCQTIPPQQWDDFLSFAQEQAKAVSGGSEWMKRAYPYVLIEE